MNIDNYNSILQSLLEDRSNVIYNLKRTKENELILTERLEKINKAISELKGKKDKYIGNRESDY